MKKIENQHGDVLLEKVLEIPSDAKKVIAENEFVIEKGEGVHCHILRQKTPCARKVAIKDGISPTELNSMMDFVEVYEVKDTMYIKVKKEVNLYHEEHGIQTLEPGIYKKGIEREYSYEQNEERRVTD